ncbi:MAG: FAD-dependent oxidoreductase, partial [Myxococcales bacterium]|nr:FAD-dependent oxidoreductase [Myxococcales bacterium]
EPVVLDESTEVSSLITRLTEVIDGNSESIRRQLKAAGVEHLHGRGRFIGPHHIEVAHVGGGVTHLEADHVVIAVGSHPRQPPTVPIDHENLLDSDSVLSMLYLPRSLTVLGAGVIASEWASIFANLGVEVTIVDRGPRPMPFLDPELTAELVRAFEADGGRYLPDEEVVEVAWDGVSEVETRLASGTVVRSRKLLCAYGRAANTRGLGLELTDAVVNERGHIEADEHGRTAAPHIYAVGDVVGPPALAATSQHQGRQAARHALGLPPSLPYEHVPIGIFTIPEMASIGLTEAEARARHGSALVGRAKLCETARGHIAGIAGGFLKLVAEPSGAQLVGAQMVGEGATELVGMAQLALVNHMPIDGWLDNVFSFPTMSEAFRLAALEIVAQREHLGVAAQ